MDVYLTLLYVTLEQEQALKHFFLKNGWKFCKPDLSVITEKIGPPQLSTVSIRDVPESPGPGCPSIPTTEDIDSGAKLRSRYLRTREKRSNTSCKSIVVEELTQDHADIEDDHKNNTDNENNVEDIAETFDGPENIKPSGDHAQTAVQEELTPNSMLGLSHYRHTLACTSEERGSNSKCFRRKRCHTVASLDAKARVFAEHLDTDERQGLAVDVNILLKKAETLAKRVLSKTQSKTVTCPKCNQICIRRRLKLHILSHMDLPYKCSACNLYFKTLQEQEEHKQVKHPKEYQCKQCDRKYNYLLSLRQHMQVAHRKPCEQLRFECSVCGKSFPTKGRLKVHMVSHSSERPFTCDLCGLSFKSHDALKTHSMYIHEGLPRKPYVRKYTCEYCAVTFNSGTTLKEHILRKHTENAEFRHKCDICDQSFCRPVRLEAHKNKDHFNRKPYTCSHCNKGFFIEYDCKRHMSRCSKEKDRNKSTNEKDDQAAFNIDGKTHGTSTNVSISSSGYQIYPTNSIGIDPVHSQGSGQLSFVDLGGSSVMTSYLENSTNLANTVSVTCFQPVNTTYQDML